MGHRGVGRARLYLLNSALAPDTYPGNPTEPFGELMPDGTRWAINWDDE